MSKPSPVTIRLRQAVANDPAGAVLTVSADRARRLIRTGYAVELTEADLAAVAVEPKRPKAAAKR
jgi:hypothetical protein